MNAMDEPRIVVTSVMRLRKPDSGSGEVLLARICALSQWDLATLSIDGCPIDIPAAT
ncbi:hypothetical protein [Bradyrhizobium sp. STM 3557]|uniref:hypothetical protein n=1 Tax=Bradyrhizobium sp. STM 3557 TaxID=578920 RepID=UPI0038909E85